MIEPPDDPLFVEIPIEDEAAEDAPMAYSNIHFNNDVGYSDAFVECYGRKIRFVAEEGQWIIFDDKSGWHRDSSAEVLSLFSDFARELYEEALKAAAGQDPKEAAGKISAAARLGDVRRINAALQIAKANRRLVVSVGALDQNAELLGTRNGVVSLRDGSFMPHTPDQLVTRAVACDFDTKADCPTFLHFLEEVQPDPDMRGFLQRLCGYTLTGNMGEHILPFHYGVGANGKGTFLEQTLFHIMGSYAAKLTDSLVYVDKRGNIPHLEIAGLCGVRFALGEENADGGNLNEALLKGMSGGDRQKGRFHYKPFFEFAPTAKIHLVGNHRPRISGRDDGIWRRFRLIDWPVKIPEERRNLKLREKLEPEFSGILNWMIAGALALGERGTRPPVSVMTATEKFREDSDAFGDFLREKTVEDSEGEISKGELYSTYKAYCDDQDILQRFRLTQRTFNLRIVERGYGEGKAHEGVKIWRGIRSRRALDE